MNSQSIQSLMVHGSIVLLIGLLSGLPFWLAIIGKKSGEVIRAWRVAHTTLIACGLTMLVIGLINPHLTLSIELRSILVWALILSGYSFVFALVLGAATGYRALTPKPVGFNTLLFIGHLIGACGSILALFIAIYGLLHE